MMLLLLQLGFVEAAPARTKPRRIAADRQGPYAFVNAAEEERRLRQESAAANASASDQIVPIIRRKSRSILSEVF